MTRTYIRHRGSGFPQRGDLSSTASTCSVGALPVLFSHLILGVDRSAAYSGDLNIQSPPNSCLLRHEGRHVGPKEHPRPSCVLTRRNQRLLSADSSPRHFLYCLSIFFDFFCQLCGPLYFICIYPSARSSHRVCTVTRSMRRYVKRAPHDKYYLLTIYLLLVNDSND